MWAAVKENLSLVPNPSAYTIWDIWENKANETSHPNIGSLKTVIVEEWNKMSEEFEGMQIVSNTIIDTKIEKRMVPINLLVFLCVCFFFFFFV